MLPQRVKKRYVFHVHTATEEAHEHRPFALQGVPQVNFVG